MRREKTWVGKKGSGLCHVGGKALTGNRKNVKNGRFNDVDIMLLRNLEKNKVIKRS